ncbi:MAG: T9SS type A sorting domain-containing protein [Bacteroidota bacterium]|nr:T9SS type A sorting domain-containing protein [Bacteroidota bacterium]
MKYFYTTFCLSLFSISVIAQRTVDWSINEIASPTELNSNVQTGTKVDVKLVCQNIGPDKAQTGDSLFYQFFATNQSGSNIIFWAPNAQNTNSYYLSVLTRDLDVNDTIHVSNSVQLNSYVPNSINIIFGARSLLQNRTSGLIAEDTSTTSNNVSLKQIIWYNPQKWGVGMEDVEQEGLFNIYPTPAHSYLMIQPLIQNTKENLEVILFDMRGRKVLNKTFEHKIDAYRLNIENMEEGIYILSVKQGDKSTSKKISIQ